MCDALKEMLLTDWRNKSLESYESGWEEMDLHRRGVKAKTA